MPSVGDGYNAEGYYDFMTVRGFVIDNRFNYRRDGLPISGETSLPLDNKSRIEVLKGTSGMQSGIGSPGGLVNLVVKRPTEPPCASMPRLAAGRQRAGRGGPGRALRRAAPVRPAPERSLRAAGPADLRRTRATARCWHWPATGGSAPTRCSKPKSNIRHREQPSVPGFSVLGTVVPAPGNPRINLNNQPWSQPSVFDGTTGSLRWRQRLDGAWSFTAQAATQQLKTDDRIAFPYGCSAENIYDRYCSDGTYDLYDFRSPGEERRTNVMDLALNGALADRQRRATTLTAGVQFNQVTNRFQRQAFNYAGIGNVEGTLFTPPRRP